MPVHEDQFGNFALPLEELVDGLHSDVLCNPQVLTGNGQDGILGNWLFAEKQYNRERVFL